MSKVIKKAKGVEFKLGEGSTVMSSLYDLQQRGATDVEVQEALERSYDKRNVRKLLKADIMESAILFDHVQLAAKFIDNWIDQDHFDTKKLRLVKLKEIDLIDMVVDMLVVILQQDESYMELTKVVGQMIHCVPHDGYLDSINVVSGVLVQIARADLIDMIPAYQSLTGTICISHNLIPEGETAEYINRTKFLPPLLAKPKFIKHNWQSGYRLSDSHRITKHLQQHNEDICLDVTNLVNSTAYSLNIELLKRVTDEFEDKSDFGTTEEGVKIVDRETKYELWKQHQENTQRTAIEMIVLGNKFYFEWFYDYRGRFYNRGYELHLQGKSYKKAMLDFHEEREIKGWEAYADDFDFTLPEGLELQAEPNEVSEQLLLEVVEPIEVTELSIPDLSIKLIGTPQSKSHLVKDQAKSDMCNKFIGFGADGTSTKLYAECWGQRANMSSYNESDYVFVSVNGGNRITEKNLELTMDEMDIAMDNRAVFVTDNAERRHSNYNKSGEGRIANYLETNGYVETEGNGIWLPVNVTANQEEEILL